MAKQVTSNWFVLPEFRGAKSCSSGSKNVERTLFGAVWLSVEFQVFIGNKVFCLTTRRLRGKNLGITTSTKNSTGNILRNVNKILSRWREYFKDLLNPLKATAIDTCDSVDFGIEEVFILKEMATAIHNSNPEWLLVKTKYDVKYWRH